MNATHTGAIQTGTLAPPLRQRWAVSFTGASSYPLIAGGRVFITVRHGSSEGYGTRLYALNAATGAVAWGPIELGGTYYWSGICYEAGRVFAVNFDGLMRAFDAATGSVLWSQQLPGQYSFSAPPTARNGIVYTSGAGSGGTLYAVNASTGVVLWTASVANGDKSSPAVTEDGVYVSYACPNVYKFNPTTGALLWSYRPGCSGGGGKTPVLYNGRLYVRDFPNYIFDSQTGAVLGNFTSKTAPAFSGDKGFLLRSSSGGFGVSTILDAIDLSTNTVAWSFTGDGSLVSAPIVVNNYVYAGSSSGKLYALDPATGQAVWSTNVGVAIPGVDEQNVSQPLTGLGAGEGILVVPAGARLVAYEASDVTPPTLTWGNATPAANAAGWNNTPVDIPYTTADDLSGVASATPGSPVHFDGEGANQTQTVTVTDKTGNSATFTSPAVNVDLTAPVTTAEASGTTGGDGTYVGSIQVTLSTSDNLSGVAATYYKVDNGNTQTYTEPFVIDGDGIHTVTFWSVDSAGNVEGTQDQSLQIDTTSPATTATLAGTVGNNGWYTGAVQVTLNATDGAGSGVNSTFYSIDGGAVQSYTAPFTISGSAIHTVAFWSLDNAGNEEQPHPSVTVKIDSAAPTLTWGAGSPAANAAGWNNAPVNIPYTTADDLSGVVSATPGSPVSFNAEGVNQTQTVTVTDRAGNSATFTSPAVKIDLTKPLTTSTLSGTAGQNGWYKSPVQVSLSANDNSSGVAATSYKIAGGTTQLYTAPFPVSGDGTHTISFWSQDAAGNAEGAKSQTIQVDATAPAITAAANPATLKATNKYVSVVVSGKITDAVSGFQAGSTAYSVVDEYGRVQPSGSITAQADGSYSVSISLEAKRNSSDKNGRTYTITVRASDRAGNQASKSTTFTVT